MSIEKAQALYQATKHLRFSDISAIDLQDRLALATVTAGLRPVGVLEADGLQLERIREQIISFGLHPLISKSVWSHIEWPRDHPSLRFLQLFEKSRRASTPQRVLWCCANVVDRKRLKGTPLTKQQAGLLLGYPDCCVRFEVDVNLRGNTEFLSALIAKVGSDEQSVARALRDDVGVEVSDKVFTLKNVPRTDAQFPFVMHTACDSCLGSPTSPTGQLNSAYEKLALDLDPQLHGTIIRIRTLCGKLLAISEAEKDSVFQEIQRIHRAFSTPRE